MKKGQAALEYAVIIMCVAGALIAMGIYVKRGMQGRLRQAADDLGQQYSADHTGVNLTLALTSNVTTEVITTTQTDAVTNQTTYQTTTTETIHNQSESRYGQETVEPLAVEPLF